jgi:cyclohexanecarboxylate-CoA ligase
MIGYYRDEQNTQELFTADGYSRSGDLGYDTGDGFFRVSGRLKDIIIRGGINISAREIEDLVLEMDQVADVAVVSMPDPRMGEKACAYVALAHGVDELTLQDVVAHLRTKNMAVQKLPERLEVLETLPLTPGNKTDKQGLRDDIRAKLSHENQAQRGTK